jgi:molybdopterin synthase sulfur carrier subunit
MKVQVKYYAMVRDATGITSEIVELDNGLRIQDLLRTLAIRYGEKLRRYIYGREDEIEEYLMITVNDVDIMSLNKYETVLHDGDTVLFIPPIGGG